MMNKLRVVVITIAILVLFSGTSFAFFENKKLKETEEKLASTAASYDKVAKDYEKLKAESEDKYATLAKENEALKQDRENLMAQAKNLLVQSNRAKELEEMASTGATQKKAVEEERNKLRQESAALKKDLQQLKSENRRISKDLDIAKSGAQTAKKDTMINDLRKQVAELKSAESKINSKMGKTARDAKTLADKNAKLEDAKANLEKILAKYKKEYADALKTNRAFEQDMKNIPKKFSETARQNKQLIKETSEMHYNLGVFYVKNKEFERARAEFEKTIEINPDDAYAHFNLGYIYAEHLVDRKKAVAQFRHYLRLSKKGDKDADWAKKYILTWQTFEGKEPME